jgi:hypothetical protein
MRLSARLAEQCLNEVLDLEIDRLKHDKASRDEGARLGAIRAQTVWPMIPALIFLGLGVALAYRYVAIFRADRWPAGQGHQPLPPLVNELVSTTLALEGLLVDVITWAVNSISGILTPVSAGIKGLILAALTAVILNFAAGRRWVTTAGIVTAISLVAGTIVISILVQHRAWTGSGPAPARATLLMVGAVIWTWVLFHDFPTVEQIKPVVEPTTRRRRPDRPPSPELAPDGG